jgi:hypothetical protein
MATNEVLKICRRCRGFTAVPIDTLDAYGRREVLCEECNTASTVTSDPYEPSQHHAVWGNMLERPTPAMWATFMPAMEPRRRRRESRLLGPPNIAIA